jgi:hypothetical protein
MERLRSALYNIVAEHQPCSVRQVYYVGIGRFWDKDQGGSRANYKRVCHELGVMREDGVIPWPWITDSTRRSIVPTMYDSHQEALQVLAETYRRDVWAGQPRRVEVWAESDSIAGVVKKTTMGLGVGLNSCRGQAGKAFTQISTATQQRIGKPVTILYVGDWDPTGLAIPRSVEERLHRYSNGAVEVDFYRLAVTPEDIISLDLATHDVNRSDPNYRRYARDCERAGLDPQVSVEVEALPPDVLRDRLKTAIYDLVEDADAWNSAVAAQAAERHLIADLAQSGEAA